MQKLGEVLRRQRCFFRVLFGREVRDLNIVEQDGPVETGHEGEGGSICSFPQLFLLRVPPCLSVRPSVSSDLCHHLRLC